MHKINGNSSSLMDEFSSDTTTIISYCGSFREVHLEDKFQDSLIDQFFRSGFGKLFVDVTLRPKQQEKLLKMENPTLLFLIDQINLLIPELKDKRMINLYRNHITFIRNILDPESIPSRKMSEEQKKKISNANKGKSPSVETRQKISKKVQDYWSQKSLK